LAIIDQGRANRVQTVAHALRRIIWRSNVNCAFRAGLGRAAVLAATLCLGIATAQGQSFRAFWADAFSGGFKSTSQINNMIARAVSGNYNAIFIEVLAFHDNNGSAHGAYWNSSIVPKATDISGGIDPLALVVSAAHANGIEVHAWIIPFRVSSTWPPSGNSHIQADWLMVQDFNIGSIAKVDDGSTAYYTLDAGHPEVQEYLIDIVRELTTNYDIDGINLDRIRYQIDDAGYPAVLGNPNTSLERFKTITGYVGTPPADGNTQWDDFRRRGISEVVRRMYAEMHSITSNPRQPLRMTADLIAFGNSTSNFTNTSAYNLFQDWKTWVDDGYLDAAVVMNYKREWSPPQDTWYRNWVNQALIWIPADRHYFAGQGNYLNPKADSITQLAYSLGQGADGVVNYSYAATADDNEDGNHEQDWTWYTYVSSNLFTSPVATPDMPWHDPAFSAEACIWGQVLNETTGLPVDNADVLVDGVSVRTDANGFYVRPRVNTGVSGRTVGVGASGDGCPTVSLMTTVHPAEFVRIDLLLCPIPELTGDMDEDGDVDFNDFQFFTFCYSGEGATYVEGNFCLRGDYDEDMDIDTHDLAGFQQTYGAP
jgi:uncharacterized lipoprotein YddW (UPF0748 family)